MRETTRRTRGVSLEQVIRELNRFIPGWLNYFRIGLGKKLIQELNHWIIRRLRVFLWKKWCRSEAEAIFTNVKKRAEGEWSPAAHESEEPETAGDRPRRCGQAREHPERTVARQRIHADELCTARPESEAIDNLRRK